MGKTILPNLKNQQGAVLTIVLIVMILMIILSAAAYHISQSNTQIVTRAATNEKALYAAEQGYNKVLWRLNNEKNSFLKNEDSSPEELTYNGNPYNLYELSDGPNYRLNVLVPLVDIPGQTDKVEDNNRRIIRSTGWEKDYPEQLRSIEVEVYKKTFAQYAMANDSEIYNNNALYWLSEEVIYGPLHTNDVLYVKGTPIFYGPVTYVSGINITPSENINNPAIFRKGNSQAAEVLSFSSSLNELKAYARIDGHYYNGRTCIQLLADGRYNARYYDQSTGRWYYNGVEYEFVPTRDGQPVGPLNYNAWSFSELNDEKASNQGLVMFKKVHRNAAGVITGYTNHHSFKDFIDGINPLELPANGVIYVDGNTGGGTDSAGISKFGINLGNVFVSGKLNGRLTIAAANDIYVVGHNPCDWAKPSFDWSSSKWYQSDWYDSEPGVTYSGTSFVQKFTGDEWTHTEVEGSSGEDMLGLVATNHVKVLHYNWLSQYHNVPLPLDILHWFDYNNYCFTLANQPIPKDNAPYNIYLHAAIYAQNAFFGFEAYDRGVGKGKAYMIGSIAQKTRGPQGVQGFLNKDGYLKEYSHDPRLLYDAPPHFPDPANSGWQSSRWDEIYTHIE
jgi:hypothetical protein